MKIENQNLAKFQLDDNITSQPQISDMKIEEKWLTTEEAALYLRISKKCLLNQVSSGKIPYYKFGKRNRYLQSDLRQLLLANPRGGLHGN